MPLRTAILLFAAAAAPTSPRPLHYPTPYTYPFARVSDRDWNAVPAEEPPVHGGVMLGSPLPADTVELGADDLAQTITNHSISSQGNGCGDCDFAELFEPSGAWHLTYWGRAMEMREGEWRLQGNRVCVLDRARPLRKLCRRMWRDTSGQLYFPEAFRGTQLYKIGIG